MGSEGAASPLEKVKASLSAAELDTVEVEASLLEVENEMADLRAKISEVETRAEEAEITVKSVKDQILRLNADFDNYRRRTAQEKEQISEKVRCDIVADLLPLVDNFELARTQVKAETEGEQKINNSYQSLYKQMVEIMRSLGVEAVETEGHPFNPEYHDGIMREPSDEVPDGTVLMELRKGFKLGDRLIRPAMVKVSYSDSVSTTSGEATEEEKVPREEAVKQ